MHQRLWTIKTPSEFSKVPSDVCLLSVGAFRSYWKHLMKKPGDVKVDEMGFVAVWGTRKVQSEGKRNQKYTVCSYVVL